MEENAPPKSLTGYDWLLVLVLTGTGLFLRASTLDFPAEYFFDEVYYVEAAEALWNLEPDPNSVHPPLGKLLIGLGMKLAGFCGLAESVGWRLTCLVMGGACIPLTYWLAHRLSAGQRFVAALAAGFVAVDHLHVVQSRIAMLDMPMAFFCLLGVCFSLRYAEQGQPLAPALGAGLSFGLATACKWSGLFAAAGAVAAVALWDWRERKPAQVVRLTLCCALLIPLVFLGSYFHHFQRQGFSLSSVVTIGDEADRMVSFRYDENQFQHRYRSYFYSWPALYKPVWYYYQETDGIVEGIVAFGCPVFWLVSGFFLIESIWKDKERLFLLTNYLGNWLLWIVSTTGGFFYYMLPEVPLMACVTALGCREGLRRPEVAVFLVALLVSAALYMPFAVAYPVEESYFRRLFIRNWI